MDLVTSLLKMSLSNQLKEGKYDQNKNKSR